MPRCASCAPGNRRNSTPTSPPWRTRKSSPPQRFSRSPDSRKLGVQLRKTRPPAENLSRKPRPRRNLLPHPKLRLSKEKQLLQSHRPVPRSPPRTSSQRPGPRGAAESPRRPSQREAPPRALPTSSLLHELKGPSPRTHRRRPPSPLLTFLQRLGLRKVEEPRLPRNLQQPSRLPGLPRPSRSWSRETVLL